ncbi:uncharacterized protein LY79DRAFT_653779 [Colletotrichum navitas]|uniref:AB hydrolase-1 domain-containing protein n=1 Tax=Colletotrichum navitas TaxID=681940 RepID=A0AAD8PLJ1_9PEZI|nr:uncharacterized protein LY79DRAFT_653779 [Colletotrichum navitas]KAK1569781.1 hypothetical protein LY79DRAFT_653779 [Colletotrichum navitas]
MRSSIPLVVLQGLFALSAEAQNPHHVVDPALFPGITPSNDLVWHDCYTVFKCARLTVHAKVADPRRPKKVEGNCGQPTVDLAIVKLPYFPGALHVSLGGWSSSYTNFLVRFGEDYAPLFAGYDLLAIDYRGWGWSTPAFRCFASEDERKQFALSEPQLLGADDAAYAAREKRADEFAKKCKKNGEDVGRFMGTYSNAVDHYTVMRAENRTKMGFWGISSGAHLGRTIAQLYPEVVEKFLFDSPAPSSLAYTVTTAQPSQIKNAERGLEAFFYTYLKAPAGNCSFAGPSTTTVELRGRYNALETKLKTGALTVNGTSKRFDWSALHSFLTISLHGPGCIPVLGGVLSEIGYVTTSVLNQPPAPLPLLTEDAPFEGILAGVCTDERQHVKGNRDDFKSYFKSMTEAAPSVAAIFSEWRLVCSKWKTDPVNVLDGQGSAFRGPVKTQGKFVVVNGVGDPASSVEGAKGVAAQFSPSVLVKTLAAGHTSFTAINDCLFGVFCTFFVLGQMPAGGATCGNLSAPPFGAQLPSGF